MIKSITIHFTDDQELLFKTDNYDNLALEIREGFTIITQYKKHFYYNNSTIEWMKREDIAN